MKAMTRLLMLAAITLVFSAAAPGYAADAPTDSPAAESGQEQLPWEGMVRFGYTGFFIDGDAGRFREDQYTTDSSTGGLDWFHVSSRQPDANGLEFLLEGRSIYDYDYRYHALLKKKDVFYLDFDMQANRRYYDGSNEYWNPSTYSMGSSAAEMSDERFFIDRRDYNVELGLTPRDLPEVVFGWHRWRRVGKEVLLRGARTRLTGDPVARFRGIPAISEVNGTADTFYIEIAHTFAKKYNIRFRQEFEEYRDEQYIVFPRYRDGVLEQLRTFYDDPGYRRYNTRIMFDSFLDERTYVTLNYMYDYIRNDSSRDSVRPNLVPPEHFTNNRVGASRYTNVWAGGIRKADLIDGMHASVGARVEKSDTQAKSFGLAGGTTPRRAETTLAETRVGESIRVVYDKLAKTTLSFNIDLEQRYIKTSEFEDVQSYEIVGEGAPPFLIRSASIQHQDQTYTIKAVHQFNSAFKARLKYRIKNFDRNYTETRDNSTAFYPGVLGDYRRTGNELTVGADWRISPRFSTTAMYQFFNEAIRTALGGKTQNFNVHRGSGSITVNPLESLVLVGTFMFENYRLETPAAGGVSAIQAPAQGSGAYDTTGTSFSVAVDGTYAFNNRTSCYARFQHTEALGESDYAGNYNYDEVGIGMKFKPADNQEVGLGYQFKLFNSHEGANGWDDYNGHGVYVTYAFNF